MISKKLYLKPHEINIVQQHWFMQKRGHFNLELYTKFLINELSGCSFTCTDKFSLIPKVTLKTINPNKS